MTLGELFCQGFGICVSPSPSQKSKSEVTEYQTGLDSLYQITTRNDGGPEQSQRDKVKTYNLIMAFPPLIALVSKERNKEKRRRNWKFDKRRKV